MARQRKPTGAVELYGGISGSSRKALEEVGRGMRRAYQITEDMSFKSILTGAGGGARNCVHGWEAPTVAQVQS